MSTVISFRPAVEQLLNTWKEINADGKLTTAEMMRIFADGLETLETLVRDCSGDDPQFDRLVEDCEDLVSKYVVPYDLPFVNAFTENFLVDPQLVPLVRPALTELRKKIQAN